MSLFNKQELFWKSLFENGDQLTKVPSFKFANGGPLKEENTNSFVLFPLRAVSKRISTMTKGNNTATYLVLLSGVQAFLYKYTDQTTSIVGVPILNSMALSESNDFLLLKNKVMGSSNFKTLSSTTMNALKLSMENQKIPFRKMIENIDIHYNSKQLPNINIIVSLDELHGMRFIENLTYDLWFQFSVKNNDCSLTLNFNKELYDYKFIQSMTTYFEHFLSNIIFQSDVAFDDVDLLSKNEKQRMLNKFGGSKEPIPGINIHGIFEKQVRKTPNNTAVVFKDYTLTYSELNQEANKLARFLGDQGVKKEDLVGIMIERSVEMVIGILAVLKVGAAFIPIDPEYPEERIQYMLEDSQTQVLLTQTGINKKLNYSGKTYYLDKNEYFNIAEENLNNDVQGNNLAYVIYTSGTTGKPKGVLVEHRGLCNLEPYFSSTLNIVSSDRVVQFASLSFDASIWEMIMSLFFGASLYIPTKEIIHDYQLFQDYINTNKISAALLPPAYVTYLEPDDVPTLKKLITGGSASSLQIVDKWRKKCLYLNAYGPTEDSIVSTVWDSSKDQLNHNCVPIGTPIFNHQAYILNKNGQLQPIGIMGELHVSGVGVARGYLNRPELTAEKFIENQFHEELIMYKTGDLARYLPDGNIEYMGRSDDQVKIRGHRIELSEVEAHLMSVQFIKEAVVTATEDNDNKQLCAYYVSREEVTLQQLKLELSKIIPAYMMPSYFVKLEKMPLTTNGKIDRKSLPSPQEQNTDRTEYIAPRDHLEEVLVSIWQTVLGVSKMGIEDNFFDLGGDSIKSIQVSSRLFQAGYKVEMKHLFKYPTIATLSPHLIKITRVPSQEQVKGEIKLTPIQHWFFKHKNIDSNFFNQSFMLKYTERLNEKALHQSIKKLVEHHDALRMVFLPVEQAAGYQAWNQAIEDSALYHLEHHDFREWADPSTAVETAATQIQSSMSLENGPLVRLGWFQCADGDHLLIAIHHLVVDGVSWRILLEDFASAYEQAIAGKEIKLPQKTDSFQLWADQLSTYAKSEVLNQEKAYWVEVESRETGRLPKDREAAEHLLQDSEVVSVVWSEAETEQLLKQTHQAYRTEINDLLLTALGMTVQEWTGMEAIRINLEGHGREQILEDVDISRTVGWFTSQFPVVLPMTHGEAHGRRIKRVKEELRQIPNKGMGYGLLRYLGNPEDVWWKESPEISFNYLGQFDQDLENSGLSSSRYSSGESESQRHERSYVLDINGMIADGCLTLGISYSRKQYEPETIEQLGARLKQHLSTLIAHCVSQENRELTPSDVTLQGIGIEELEALVEQTADQGEIEEVYPLTPMQKGMLFHSLLDPESGAYFEQATLTIEGNINAPKFAESIRLLSKRHAILRTNFYNGWENTPLQIVYKDKGIEFSYKTLDKLIVNGQDQNSALRYYIEEDNRRGFDLYNDPLMRISILQVDKEKYHMIWSFHHILMDGWCAPLLFNELFTNYYSLCQNKEIIDTPITPYSQYIEWLDKQDQNKAADYWNKYLEGYDENTSISNDISKESEGEQYDIDEVICELGTELTNKLKFVANQEQVTVNTIIQSAWGILLQRYNNTRDVLFGTVVSGRPTDIYGIEQMIGLFINTIPVRIQSNKECSFESLIKKIQQQAVESNNHDTYPLYEIQRETEQKQELINHIMVFENYPMDTKPEENISNEYLLKVENADVKEQTNYNFNLIVAPGNSYKIRLNYNKNAYNRTYIEKIKEHLYQILYQTIENPNILLDEIEIVNKNEKVQLLEFCQDKKFEFMHDMNIIQLFENQVRQTPDKTALLYGEESLTYLELNQYANKIAHMLKRKNIGSDEVVGLMVDRSLDMIIGVLGILKVGAAYLPIDPDFPNDRIEFMLNDSKSKLLLFHSHLKREFPQHIEQLCWDNRICEIAQNDDDANLNLEITANQLAYIIYTSGTTGQPKGILTSHKNVIRVVKDTNYIAINSSDNILQLSNYAFDGSIFDIFGALLNGAQLVMITKEILLDIRKLADCLVEKKVNVLFITTALFNVLIDYSLDSLINIRKVLFGGERASHLHVKKALKYLSANKIIHVYGPTESTVFATYYEVNELDEDVTNIPIGKPLGYTKVYILNDSCQLQPIGIAGELCIGGSGLAKGYLNRLDLTEDKFITDPFNDGEKIYKTGDLARWLPDGNIEYFGRIDHQVKIRGYRIEIGEIEAQLLKMESIHEVIVIVKEEQPSLKKLYAYWVGDSTLETNSIRNHLTKSLPEYMIPSYFIRLEHLPLTLNGKVNTKLLPSLSLSESRENDFVAPQTKNEKLLAEIWCNVLGLDSISTSDNFFEIGGDSIKTIQITAKLAQLGYELEMKHWFKHQTIRQLSKNIKQNAVMVEQREVYGEVPLTPIQRWFISQNYDEPHYFNQSMMLFSQELYKEDTICTTMNHILAHHDYLRTVLKQSNESIKAWNRKISSENLYSLTVYDLDDCIDLPGTIERLANQTQGALNLNDGPLINVAIFKTSSGDHLLISVHHFIIDMVSWRILLEDFSTVYKQVRNHEEIKLPNKTSSFQDWASSLLQYAQSAKLIEEKKYWNKIFERNYNQLPKDYKENKGTVTTSETVTVSLSSKDTEALLKNSHQTYNTEINDLLLVALGMSVKKWANINDIMINLEGHGREQLFNHLNITRTVGWFTTQYPVVLNMEESSNLEKTIQQTRDMLREIPNKGIGYGILKYLSSATEDFKNHYIPEISFNYLGQFDQDLQNNTNYLSDYSKGSDVSLKQSRTNSLDIYGMAINGKLSLTINYSNLQYRKKTIMSLVKLLEDNLKQVIHHCSTKNTETLISYSNTTPVLNNIEEFSNKLFDENYILDVPGISMVVVKDGKVVFSKGYGYSDVISQTPMNSTSSLMRVGSITKLMTSSITLQLEKEGKLSLSQDISNYLEDLPIPRTINSSLTIEHLLNYSSGFDIQNKGMNQLFDINGTLSLKEFIELNMPSVIREPGKSYQYESFGFLLLGYLIEKIEGISFGDYISERLLKPLEMNSSNLVSNLLIEKRLASGYDLENKYVGMYSYSSLDSSSGGMISTGSDLAKFMMMLLQNGMYKGKQILSETVTKKMLELKEENKLGRSYGQYGFELNFHPSYMDLPIFSKSGNIHGYSSFTWLIPKENLGVLVLSNKSIMNKIEIFEQFMDTYYPHYKNTPSVSLI